MVWVGGMRNYLVQEFSSLMVGVGGMKNYLVQEVELLDGVGWGDGELPGKGG